MFDSTWSGNGQLRLLARLRATTAEKKVLETNLPVLEQRAQEAETRAVATQGIVVVKTNEVAVYAEKAAEKEKENGSLGALLHKLLIGLGVSVALYVFVHFILPSLAQEFPGARMIVGANKAAKSIFSSHL